MDASIFLRFDEPDVTRRPIDAAGGLNDLEIAAGLVMPTIVDGVTGKAREFSPVIGNGLQATDQVSGSTLLNRDVTIQSILRWDIAAQNAHGNPGTLIARGKGNSASEYMPYAIEFRVVNMANSIGEVRFLWHDAGGVLKTQGGGYFQADTGFVMITCTRRWASSTACVLRYYLGDELLSEAASVDGSIGGGTTGTTAIGARFTGGAYARFFAGDIDQLRVVDREMTAEEIRATWARLTVHQPRARQLVRELHPPGFPISDNPGSRVQRETSLWGDALGYATAQAENMRDNIMPDRAYGEPLEQWEGISGQPAKLGDSTDQRRKRVTGRMAQRQGIAIEGLMAALKPVIAADESNLEVLAYDQTITDDFSGGIRTQLWTPEPAASWTIDTARLKVADAAGTYGLTSDDRAWRRYLTSIGGEGKGARLCAKLTPTAVPANAEVGLVLGDDIDGNYVMVGLRNVAGTYKLFSTTIFHYVATSDEIVSFGGLPATLWLLLGHIDPSVGTIPSPEVNPEENYELGYSQVSLADTVNQLSTIGEGNPRRKHWAGFYFRTVAATASGVDVKFDDARVRAPCGERSFYLYVYRDPALPGEPDIAAANNIIRGLRQAHTHAAVITSKQVLCTDPTTPCGFGPMGEP